MKRRRKVALKQAVVTAEVASVGRASWEVERKVKAEDADVP